jgi:hypothetical protein
MWTGTWTSAEGMSADTKPVAFEHWEMVMRIVIGVAAICLGAYSVMAASPNIETAAKTFRAVAADPPKLKTFCAMDAALEAAAEKKDKAAGSQIVQLMKQLEPEFESAWNAGEGVDDAPDGKAFVSALNDLTDKCP